jgi:hypothetical protein
LAEERRGRREPPETPQIAINIHGKLQLRVRGKLNVMGERERVESVEEEGN